MGEIINLRRVRKARARAADAAEAAVNRAAYGRTKAERLAEAGKRQRRDSLLDGLMVKRDGAE